MTSDQNLKLLKCIHKLKMIFKVVLLLTFLCIINFDGQSLAFPLIAKFKYKSLFELCLLRILTNTSLLSVICYADSGLSRWKVTYWDWYWACSCILNSIYNQG